MIAMALLVSLAIAPSPDPALGPEERPGTITLEVLIEDLDPPTLPTPTPTPTRGTGELPATGTSFDALLWSGAGAIVLAGGAALAVHARTQRRSRG